MNYIEILKQGLDSLKLPYDDEKLHKFEIYTEFLLEYNQKVNLTAITEPEKIAKLHYLDSVSLLHYVNIKTSAKIVDIGSGAGFPLVPVKIIRPDLDCLLVDSLNKRVVFLEKLMERLNLTGIMACHARAEETAADKRFRGSFDYVTVRAVAELRVLAEYALPLLKKGGKLLALKGPKAEEELKSAQNALKILGADAGSIIDETLPDEEFSHKITVITKTGHSPAKYPRAGAQIRKKPL